MNNTTNNINDIIDAIINVVDRTFDDRNANDNDDFRAMMCDVSTSNTYVARNVACDNIAYHDMLILCM